MLQEHKRLVRKIANNATSNAVDPLLKRIEMLEAGLRDLRLSFKNINIGIRKTAISPRKTKKDETPPDDSA